METIQRNKWANGTLLVTTVIYLLINGAGLFETAVIIPQWTAAPPASLQMFNGPYALDFKAFWIAAHSIHEITFIIALICNWKIKERKKYLLIIFILHIAVRVWTIAYFVPVIISFQQMAPSGLIDAALKGKADMWANLNIIRCFIFTLLSLALIPIYKK